MSNLYDLDDRDISCLPPASSLGGKADSTCSGMASGASEREARSFFGRGFGLGTSDGQPVRETIGFAAVRAGCRFELSSDWPLRFSLALEFLRVPLRSNSQVRMQRFREEYIPEHVAAGRLPTPIVV
jgi:hypothetical protein